MPLVARLVMYGFAVLMLVGAIYLSRLAVNFAHNKGRRVTFAELLLGLMTGYVSMIVFVFMLLQDIAGWSHPRAQEAAEILMIPLVVAFTLFLWQLRRAIDEMQDKSDL